MSLLDTFSRALYDAAAGYQDYTQRVKPALDEQAFVRGERARVATQRDQAAAGARLHEQERLYGGPQGAAQRMGIDAYNTLRKQAGFDAIATRDQPITETTTTERPVFPTPGAFSPEGPATQLEVPGQPVTIPRGVSGDFGGQPIPARTASTFIPQPGPPTGSPEDRATYQQDVQTRATGQTQRVLDLPEALTIATPMGRMTPEQLKLIPEELKKQWWPDPMVRLGHMAYIARSDTMTAIAHAHDVTTRYVHDTASANAVIQARTAQMEVQATLAYHKLQIAVAEGNLVEAERHHRKLEEMQKEANNIRYQRLLKAGATLDQMKDSDLNNAFRDVNQAIRDQRDLISGKVRPENQKLFEDLTVIQQGIVQRIQRRALGSNAAPPPSSAVPTPPAAAPTPPASFGHDVRAWLEDQLGMVPPARPGGAPASPVPPARPGGVTATLTPPARPGAGEARPSGPAGLANPAKVYQTQRSGTKTAATIKSIIDAAIRGGIKRDVIRQSLIDDGIPPADFGY